VLKPAFLKKPHFLKKLTNFDCPGIRRIQSRLRLGGLS
jgi:hypothetical protein